MPLTYPAPSKRLRQAEELAKQIYASIHELEQLADGDPDQEAEVRQLHSSVNVLIHTINEELTCWQQMALTASRAAADQFQKRGDPFAIGILHGSISVRAGRSMEPLQLSELVGIDSWWPVHRGE